MPENCVAGSDRQDRGAEQRGDLGAGEGRDQHAVAGRRGDVDQRAERSVGKLPLSGTWKTNSAIRNITAKLTSATAM